MVQFLFRPEIRIAGLASLAECFSQSLTAKQNCAIHCVIRAEGSRNQIAGRLGCGGGRAAELDFVAGVEADRLRHLDNQNAVPQTSLTHEQRVLLGHLRATHGLSLPSAEVGRADQSGVLLGRAQQHAHRCVLAQLVVLKTHGRRRQRHRIQLGAQGINQINVHHVRGRDVDFAGSRRNAFNAGAGGNEVAILGRSLDGIHADAGKVRIGRDRHSPFDIVGKATRTGHMDQRKLIVKALHVVFSQRTGKAAHLVRGALLRHRAACADRLAGLVDPQRISGEAHRVAATFGVSLAHDRLAAERVDEVEGNFVAGLLCQVHTADDRHFIARLAAQGCFCVGLLRQFAGQSVQRGLTLHIRSEQTHGHELYSSRVAIRDIGFAGHFSNLQRWVLLKGRDS